MILTVFDTETSGLNPDKHEILEVAMISFILDREGNAHLLSEYESKVKPVSLHSASEKALKINGYTEQAWQEAPTFSEVYREMQPIIEKSDIFLGQNLIFDIRFVDELCRRNELGQPDFPSYIDTKEMADKLVEKAWLKRSGMDYLVEHYNVAVKGRAHTALVDCWRTFEVWQELLKDTGGEYSVYTPSAPYEGHRRRS